MTTAYLAAEGFADQLQEELRRAGAVVIRRHERLFVCDGPALAAAWAANIWHDCLEVPVASIGSAALALRDIQRNWVMYAPLHHRRASLIQLSQSNRPFITAEEEAAAGPDTVSVLLQMDLHNGLWRSKERARRFRTWHPCLHDGN